MRARKLTPVLPSEVEAADRAQEALLASTKSAGHAVVVPLAKLRELVVAMPKAERFIVVDVNGAEPMAISKKLVRDLWSKVRKLGVELVAFDLAPPTYLPPIPRIQPLPRLVLRVRWRRPGGTWCGMGGLNLFGADMFERYHGRLSIDSKDCEPMEYRRFTLAHRVASEEPAKNRNAERRAS